MRPSLAPCSHFNQALACPGSESGDDGGGVSTFLRMKLSELPVKKRSSGGGGHRNLIEKMFKAALEKFSHVTIGELLEMLGESFKEAKGSASPKIVVKLHFVALWRLFRLPKSGEEKKDDNKNKRGGEEEHTREHDRPVS